MSKTTRQHSESMPESKIESADNAEHIHRPRSIQPVAIIALLLSLTTVVGIAYIGWQGLILKRLVNASEPQLQRLDSGLRLQSHQIIAINTNLIPLQQKTDTLDQDNKRLLSNVNVLSDKVRGLEGSTRTESYLVEVEYLLRLANQRLLMSSDVGGANKLLQNADDILRTLDDNKLSPVREALAQDIIVLKAIPNFDLKGTYFQLQAISEYVKALSLSHVHVKEFKSSDHNKKDLEEHNWKSKALSILNRLWQNFSSLFRFTSNRTQAIHALLTPEQEQLVRQNLQLLIEQGKLALLAHQQAIYKSSLLEANKWLTKYFSQNGDAVDAISQELSRLIALDINPKLPTTNAALDALKKYRSQQLTKALKYKPATSGRGGIWPLNGESHSKISLPIDVSHDKSSKLEEE